MTSEAEQHLEDLRLRLIRRASYGAVDPEAYHPEADTMIGEVRIKSLQDMCVSVIADKIPGDFIECGVWRGGACVLMRAVLEALGDTTRNVWVADSFKGFPRPSIPQDRGWTRKWSSQEFVVSRAQVEAVFRSYGVLDDRVRFLEGWFRDTLHTAPIEKLAVLRIDGDMYESTASALVALHSRVSPGGYVILDDYGAISSCRAAVEDFRLMYRVTAPINKIDWTGVYWRVGT